MSEQSPTRNAPALRAWRARAWAWVLFIALCKGLIPHAALASVVMDGSPALFWCAPGSGAASEAAPGMSSTAHDCVCASIGDGALPLGAIELRPAAPVALPQIASLPPVFAAARLRLPPARGPPQL